MTATIAPRVDPVRHTIRPGARQRARAADEWIMHHQELPDPELIKSCLAGQQAAWDALVDRYSRLVFSVPRRHGLSEADAAEVSQNVFLTLFRKLNTLDDHLLLARWLLTTAHRETWRVGKSRQRYAELDGTIADVSSPSDEELTRWERQHMVRQALEQLGGRCQELLTALFLSAGQPNYDAIAASLNMRVGSIGPTRARCFAKLERILIEMGLDLPKIEQGRQGELGSARGREGRSASGAGLGSESGGGSESGSDSGGRETAPN